MWTTKTFLTKTKRGNILKVRLCFEYLHMFNEHYNNNIHILDCEGTLFERRFIMWISSL